MDKSRLSILDTFLEGREELAEYFNGEGIRRQKHTLSQDFLSSNPLRKCFDYQIGKYAQVESVKKGKTSFWKKLQDRWKRVKEMATDSVDVSAEIREQEFDKLKAKHLKSAQYLVSHMLNKKEMSE